MALENDPGQQGGTEASSLEARVARLEAELAALQWQLAGAGASRPASAPPPPPPPPMPARASADETAQPAAELRPGLNMLREQGRTHSAGGESMESFESRLGSQIFNRIAIVLLLIGTAYFLKLAIDRGWIGPAGRVIAGLAAGAGLVLWSERFRLKGFAAFSYSLKAVGSGVLYLTLWAAFQLLHLVPAGAALGLMVLVTAWNAYMAWVQDSELLAVYALAGGFATPLLVSTGGNHEVFLFTYLLAMDAATAALVRLKTWPRLLLGAFPATVLFFMGWYAQWYAMAPLGVTAAFILLFGVAFGWVPIGRRQAVASKERGTPAAAREGLAGVLDDILLPLANAAFVALAGYELLQDSGNHALLPWLMVALAAVYLAVMQLPQTRTAGAVHLSLGVVFLTIAIPLKASGEWITVSWLVEGLALLWVATRLVPAAEEEQDAAEGFEQGTLRWLGLGALLLGFCGIVAHEGMDVAQATARFMNADEVTALIGIALFAVAAWLALRAAGGAAAGAGAWTGPAAAAVVAAAAVGALLTLREVLDWEGGQYHPPLGSADFATALIGLAVFVGVIAVSRRVAREREDESFWASCAEVSTIAFNLIAVLTGVREIDAIWAGAGVTADAGLQQALAISAFLMLYGAALLAVGFWRRSAFLRWQALVLLVFTIIKTFLYDMRNLSQGYRVGSILGLGVLLMAISFAYQKDWLNLRGPDAKSDPRDDQRAP